MESKHELTPKRLEYAKESAAELLESLLKVELLYNLSIRSEIETDFAEDMITHLIGNIKDNILIIQTLRKDVTPRKDEPIVRKM